MQDHTLAHAYQVDPFLAVILAVIRSIANGARNVLIASWKETPWLRQLAAALAVIPLEFVIPHNVLIISSRFMSPG